MYKLITKSRLYDIWKHIRQRCNNPNYHHYHNYGGRGIKVCDEWNNFDNFQQWALNNGYQDDLSIDRIDVNGNYEPSNCKWSTACEQANNRRSNKYIEHNGEVHTMAEWARIYNINYEVFRKRLKRGILFERAIAK